MSNRKLGQAIAQNERRNESFLLGRDHSQTERKDPQFLYRVWTVANEQQLVLQEALVTEETRLREHEPWEAFMFMCAQNAKEKFKDYSHPSARPCVLSSFKLLLTDINYKNIT